MQERVRTCPRSRLVGPITTSCVLPHRQPGDSGAACARDHLDLARSYGYVISVFTELSPTSTRTARPAPSTRRRPGTISLELQSALKFGLAVALGAVAVWAAMPAAAAALLLVTAVTLAWRSLLVLGHDPSGPRTIRPREHAYWDGNIAAVLAVTALLIAASSETVGAAAVGAGGVVLALLRLRTRYVG